MLSFYIFIRSVRCHQGDVFVWDVVLGTCSGLYETEMTARCSKARLPAPVIELLTWDVRRWDPRCASHHTPLLLHPQRNPTQRFYWEIIREILHRTELLHFKNIVDVLYVIKSSSIVFAVFRWSKTVVIDNSF